MRQSAGVSRVGVIESKAKFRLLMIAVVGAACGVAAARYYPVQRLRDRVIAGYVGRPAEMPAMAVKAPGAPVLPFGHPYYRYSVIPGGAHSREELEAALKSDAVAAQHYSDFAAKNARVIALEHDQQYYVSYRVGDKIYWTRRALTLRRGEKVLFDGVHYARARCGNRLTLVPAKPTVELANYEPDPKVFGAPVPVQASLTPEPQLEPGPALPMVIAAANPPNPLENLMEPYRSSPGPELVSYVPTRHDRATLFALDGQTPATMLPIFYPNAPISPVPEPGSGMLVALVGFGLLAGASTKQSVWRNWVHCRRSRSGSGTE